METARVDASRACPLIGTSREEDEKTSIALRPLTPGDPMFCGSPRSRPCSRARPPWDPFPCWRVPVTGSQRFRTSAPFDILMAFQRDLLEEISFGDP